MAEPLKSLITRAKAACESRATTLRADADKATDAMTPLILEHWAKKFDARAEDCARLLETADNVDPRDAQTIRNTCCEHLNFCAERITLS